MDYEKTVALYEKAGLIKKWLETSHANDHKHEKDWIKKVSSNRTGEFYQADELVKRELVPPDWLPPHTDGGGEGKAVIYPFKTVNGIVRRRLADGSEWLTSTQEWYGLDQAGNPLNKSMNNKEMYDDIFPIYKLRPENPRERDSKMIRELDYIQHRIKYTLQFSADNVQKLYDLRNGKCYLALKDESQDKPPYDIPKLESFKNSGFDELFEWASTPRTKLDRSYGDNLDNSHIG